MDAVAIATIAALAVLVAALAAYLILIAVILRQVHTNAARILEELGHVAEAAAPLRDLVEQVASSIRAPARTSMGVGTVETGPRREET